MIIRLNSIDFQCNFEENLSLNHAIYGFEQNFSQFCNVGLNGISIHFNLYNPSYINNHPLVMLELSCLSRYLLHTCFLKANYRSFIFMGADIQFNFGDGIGSKRQKYLALKEYEEKWEDDFPKEFLYLKDEFVVKQFGKDKNSVWFEGIIELSKLKFTHALQHFSPFYLPASLDSGEINQLFLMMLNSDDWMKIDTMIMDNNGIKQLFFYTEDYGFLLVGKNLVPLYKEIEQDFKHLNMTSK